MSRNGQGQSLLPWHSVGVERPGHYGFINTDTAGRQVEHLEQYGERGNRDCRSYREFDSESIRRDDNHRRL